MRWDTFISEMGHQPILMTENLRLGGQKSTGMEVQLSRWAEAGKLIQLRRGVYILGEPYRRGPLPHYALIANFLRNPSYVSLEKGLEFHGLIPEKVPTVTSITTKATSTFDTPLGIFSFRHLQRPLFWGYAPAPSNGPGGFMAHPEKCLLDLFYLNRVTVTQDYLNEMRLQNMGLLDMARLGTYAKRFGKPALVKAADEIKKYARAARKGEKTI